MKACSKCKELKPLEQFGRDSSRKDGLQFYCKACVNEWHRQRNALNPGPNREKARAWAKENREKANAQGRRWRAANPEKVSEQSKKWRAANPEKAREQSRKWAEENPDRVLERHRRWRAANPEKVTEKFSRRRARKTQNGVFLILPRELKRLKASPCAVCGSRERIHLDHIIPLARGGRHSIGNLQPLCAHHNQSKGAKTLTEWKYAA